ncbi:hypothetical protein HM1_1647 [Heliomicrobium modesticaldum Ice1]|uniref:Abc transporter, permease protein n=1 Tax=Heliobacterium modesticaldum (strain ATCC 51547 / Ice1) TaxID=498761 RepID=B0TE22_HELMI|nr:ABC transporter permease [Heliomicrobium modesticaldum]ABZ84217.1 hypothetical protein HM1_1647 [Heliomicrobium modesticaldum Ice1]
MILSIRLEMTKWKRSRMVWMTFLGSVVAPFFALISSLQTMSQTQQFKSWDELFAVAFQINHLLFYPFIFGAVASYVFVQEYQGGAIINLFTLPVSRARIIVSKIITVFLFVMLLSLVSTAVTFLFGWKFTSTPLDWNLFIRNFQLAMETTLMQFMLVPIIICIGLWTKHFVPPLVGAGLFVVLNFVSFVSSSVGPFIPTAIPTFVVLQHVGWNQFFIPLNQ